MILDWILDAIPLWVWIALGVALVIGVFATLRILGLSPKQVWALTATAAAAVGAALLYKKGRQTGAQAERARVQRARAKAKKESEAERARIEQTPLEDKKKELRTKWPKQ